jgi:DNA-binding transcriptional LysR family regulator
VNAIIDLRALSHFVLAAEELNFARAAERAHLTQTPFGRSIQALEYQIGLRLFDRTTRSVALTVAGRRVLALARDLLAHARSFEQETLDLAGSQAGELAFGASEFAVDTVLPGVLPKIQSVNPKLKLNISISHWNSLVAQLDEGKIEFFVAFPGSLVDRRNYCLTTLPSQPASLFCRRGHPLLSVISAPTRASLLDYPWGALDISDTTVATVMESLGAAGASGLPIGFNCASKQLLLEAMLSSDLIAACWGCWLDGLVAAGRVVDLGARVRPSIPLKYRAAKCALIERAERTLSPSARKLKDAIIANARSIEARRA